MFIIVKVAGWLIFPLLRCAISAVAWLIEPFISWPKNQIILPRLFDKVLATYTQSSFDGQSLTSLKNSSILGLVFNSISTAKIKGPLLSSQALQEIAQAADRIGLKLKWKNICIP